MIREDESANTLNMRIEYMEISSRRAADVVGVIMKLVQVFAPSHNANYFLRTQDSSGEVLFNFASENNIDFSVVADLLAKEATDAKDRKDFQDRQGLIAGSSAGPVKNGHRDWMIYVLTILNVAVMRNMKERAAEETHVAGKAAIVLHKATTTTVLELS